MELIKSFGVLDYIVFIGMFLVSIALGILSGYLDRRHQNNERYLMGGRKLNFIAVSVSITVSVVSTATLLGAPAEMYSYGISYMFVGLSAVMASCFVAIFFVPLIYPLKITSITEYLERRFSKSVRYLGCVLFLMNLSFYVGTVIFGPATALSLATGAPPWIAIIIVSVIGTLYTTIGGVKAVVWSDAFQSIVMVTGLIAVCVLGISKVGGIREVVSINSEWGRLDMDYGLSLTSRFGLFVIFTGYTNHWVAGFSVNQACSQRYCSTDTMSKGKLAVMLNGPLYAMMTCLSMLTGMVAFAYYTSRGCDPIKANVVSNANQIMPYFVLEVLGYPGVPGIFISSLFSASLSTLSSYINSMAAVTWEDIFKDKYQNLSYAKQTMITKIMVIFYGLVCMAVSFLVLGVGGNLVQISASFFGATIGPTLGLFVLGGLVPWANWKGALLGGLSSISLSLWIMFGQVFAKLLRATLDSPVHNCWNTTGIYNSSTLSIIENLDYLETTTHQTVVESQGFLHSIYSLSFGWFSLLGTISVILIGTIVSLLTGGNDTENMDSSLLFVCLRKRYGKTQVVKPHEKELLVFSNQTSTNDPNQNDKTTND